MFSLFFVVLLVSSCGGIGPSEPNTSYVDGILENLEEDLLASTTVTRSVSSGPRAVISANNLTIEEVETIIRAGRSKVEAADLLESTNISELLPLILGGAQSNISSLSSADTVQLKGSIIQTLVQSCVRIVDEKTESNGEKKDLIVAVTETAIENIVNTGINTNDIDIIAGKAVSVVVDSVEAVFNINSVGDVVNEIASGSVAALAEVYNDVTSNDVNTELVGAAVSTITQTVIDELKDFDDLTETTLGNAIVDVSSSLNTSLPTLLSELDPSVADSMDLESLAGSVVSTVTETVMNEGLDETILNDVISGTITDLEGTGVDVEDLAREVTTAAVDSVSGNAALITIIIVSVSEGVNSTQADAAADIDVVTIINEAFSIADETVPIDIDDAISEGEEAADNTAPVISSLELSANNMDAGTDVAVTVTVEAADSDPDDSLSYFWEVSPGIEIISGDSTSVLTITSPAFDGNFFITAVVDDGKESVFETVILTVAVPAGESDAEKAARLVNEGKAALANRNLDEALVFFTDARALDSANVEASLFWAYMNMASIMVDPAVQEIVGNAGFLSYPQTMEEVIAGDWMTVMPVLEGYELEYNGTAYELEPWIELMPEISVPNEYTDINIFALTNDDGDNIEEQNTLNFNEYIMALIYNLQAAYSDGINAPVSSVVDILTEKLDETIAVLDDLSNSASITFESGMFNVDETDPFEEIWPADEAGDPIDIVVGRSEVLLSMASLQIMNSLLNSVLAIDLTVSVSAFYSAMNPVDGTFWGNAYLNQSAMDEIESAYNWSTLPQYPLADGFLQTSANAGTVMTDSKTYMSNALENITEALDGIEERGSGGTQDGDFTFSEEELGEEVWSTVMDIADISSILISKLSASLTSGTTVVVPTEIFIDTDTYSVEANWPAVADWTNVTSIDDIPGAVEIDFGAIFEKPLLALDNIIELNANGEPVIYSIDGSGNASAVTLYNASALADDNSNGAAYAVKLMDITIGIVSIPDSVFNGVYLPKLNTETGDVFVSAGSGSTAVFIQVIPPSAVFSALNPAGTVSTADITSENYVKASGSFWYSLPLMADSAFETISDANNDFSEAETLTTDGSDYVATLISDQDQDYYSFTAETGMEYSIEVTFSSLDTILTLYDSEMVQISSNDDFGDTLLSRIDFVCSGSGIYYAKLSAYSGLGPYGLTISEVTQ